MQSGYVEALQLQREKGLPYEKVPSVELEAGKGIVGDRHAIGGEKQIALISLSAKQWLMAKELQGLCLSKFQENIVTAGIDYSQLTQGDILITDHIRIEITAYSKRCFPECIRVQNNLNCELKKGTGYAKVIQSGSIHVGDKIRNYLEC